MHGRAPPTISMHCRATRRSRPSAGRRRAAASPGPVSTSVGATGKSASVRRLCLSPAKARQASSGPVVRRPPQGQGDHDAIGRRCRGQARSRDEDVGQFARCRRTAASPPATTRRRPAWPSASGRRSPRVRRVPQRPSCRELAGGQMRRQRSRRARCPASRLSATRTAGCVDDGRAQRRARPPRRTGRVRSSAASAPPCSFVDGSPNMPPRRNASQSSVGKPSDSGLLEPPDERRWAAFGRTGSGSSVAVPAVLVGCLHAHAFRSARHARHAVAALRDDVAQHLVGAARRSAAAAPRGRASRTSRPPARAGSCRLEQRRSCRASGCRVSAMRWRSSLVNTFSVGHRDGRVSHRSPAATQASSPISTATSTSASSCAIRRAHAAAESTGRRAVRQRLAGRARSGRRPRGAGRRRWSARRARGPARR